MTYWIGYTTLYREGGPKFRVAAETMARELARSRPDARIVCEAVESKREFVDAMGRIRDAGESLDELHFVGHGGMYGPMFRTTSMPEQFSPHEWRTMTIPFADGGAAYFHACRSGRFFAPFFARTFGVPAHGYHHYTTFSRRPGRFAWDVARRGDGDLWIVAMPGRKSHGLPGSLAKYSHLLPVEPMKRFEPEPLVDDPSYDPVARLYDEAFADISVRAPEVAWIEAHLPTERGRVLEIGTGNGALLARLSPRIGSGLGVDASRGMIARARARFGARENLAFETIEGPRLPVPDASVDVVVSLVSWRYLDWDPMMAEIRRVLAPGGRLLVVDMVASPARTRELPKVVYAKAAQWLGARRRPRFRRALLTLVRDPRWATMLKYNPIRAEHEYRWYFESRFPGRRLSVLTHGYSSKVVAFDTGPLERGTTLPQSYP